MESIDLEIELSTVFENPQKSLIASEASYVYILSGQKFIKNAKKSFWRVFEYLMFKVKQCYQTGNFNKTTIDENSKTQNATFWVTFKHCV